MQLNNIKPATGAKHYKKRVGRGIGSGLGKTAARGHNGQQSRSGYSHSYGHEGGQMPLVRRIPKRGVDVLSGIEQGLDFKHITMAPQGRLAIGSAATD